MNQNLRYASIKLTPAQTVNCSNDAQVRQGPLDIHRTLAAWRWIDANIATSPPVIAMSQMENVLLTRIGLPLCTFCGGRGHEPKECMSRIVLDRKASELGLRFWWGQAKWGGYYQQWSNANQALHV